jgi:hypothetical protein
VHIYFGDITILKHFRTLNGSDVNPWHNLHVGITDVIIITALQTFVGPWPLLQFLDPIHNP